MRSDVKIGLICAFVIVLSVVVYFVYQGNNAPRPTQAQTQTPAGTGQPAATPAARTNDTIGIPGTGAEVAATPSTPGGVNGGLLQSPAQQSTTQPGATTPTTPPSTPTTPSMGIGPIAGNPPTTPATMPGAALGTTNTGTNQSLGTIAANTGSQGTPGASPFNPTQFGGGTTPTTPGNTSTNTRTTTNGNSPRNTGLTGALPGSPATPDPIFPNAVSSYKVQQGDMLGTIARKHGVTVRAIETANPGIDSTRLQINQEIKIPAQSSSTSTNTRTTTNGTTPTTRPANTNTASTPAKPGTSHTVKKGETLSTIALNAYGDKNAWQRIYQANRTQLPDPNNVPIGTILKIPN